MKKTGDSLVLKVHPHTSSSLAFRAKKDIIKVLLCENRSLLEFLVQQINNYVRMKSKNELSKLRKKRKYRNRSVELLLPKIDMFNLNKLQLIRMIFVSGCRVEAEHLLKTNPTESCLTLIVLEQGKMCRFSVVVVSVICECAFCLDDKL